jgi:cytochrome P450
MTDTATEFEFPDFAPTPERQAYFDEALGGWQVFGYAEAQRVLSDYTTFSSDRGGLDPADTTARSDSLGDMDPPRHRRMRALFSGAFTARTAEALAGWIEATCDRLLDGVIERGEMDLVRDYAVQVPLRTIGRLAGFPAADLEQLRTWAHATSNVRSADSAEKSKLMAGYFAELVTERTAQPGDDLLSALIAAEVDGARLTRNELVAFCVMLLTAGMHTVRDLLGNAWLCFDRYPEAEAALRADPALIPGAIEEVLRYLPPVPQFPRIAAVDTQLDGQPVRAGQWVMPRIPSANRDKAEFDRPHVFDIRRQPNRHLTLGHGIHFCVGAPLARVEARVALTVLLRRLRTLELVRDAPLVPHISPFAYGMEELPVTFTPA